MEITHQTILNDYDRIKVYADNLRSLLNSKPRSLAQIEAEYKEDVEVTEMETKDALKWLKHDIMIAVCYDCGKKFWKNEKSDEICSFCGDIKATTDYLNQPNQ